MAAYVISEVEVRDGAAMEAYRTLAAQTIAQYGGRYLARGGAAEVVEGDRGRADGTRRPNMRRR